MLDGGEEYMFILLKTGALLNLFWVQDCFQGKHDKNIVIFYTINGVKLIEEYDTEAEALARVNEVHQAMDKAGFCGDQECCVLTINGKVGDVVLKAGDILTTQGVSIQKSLDAQAANVSNLTEHSMWHDYE